jgi:hypothetical protein
MPAMAFEGQRTKAIAGLEHQLVPRLAEGAHAAIVLFQMHRLLSSDLTGSAALSSSRMSRQGMHRTWIDPLALWRTRCLDIVLSNAVNSAGDISPDSIANSAWFTLLRVRGVR